MGKVAFVFAGQGAQAVGMGMELYEKFGSARRVFDMAGEDVKRLCFEGPAEELNITLNTQPCMFAMDLACAEVLREKGITADGVAGFSLGEVPAAAYSGMMSVKQAFDFVCFRAEVMQECASENGGGMLAVLKLSAAQVESICTRIPGAYPVKYNCEGQTVTACGEGGFDTLQKAVAESGGRTIKLAVSGAFHSPYMDRAYDKISGYLENQVFGEMSVPLYANLTGRVYDDAKNTLARQVNNPVLWQKIIENMVADGFDTFIEVGPGKTLSGLIKKINGEVRILNVCDLASLEKTLSEV